MNFSINYFLTFFCCLFSLISQAQTPIRVHILSKDNGLPIEAVYVKVYQGNSQKLLGATQSNDSGTAIVTVDAFPVTIEAVAVGYEMERVVISNAPSNGAVQIKLSKTFSPLNEVVVTGVLNPIKPMDAFSNYKVIRSATMQSMGAATVQDALGYQLNVITSTDGVLGGQIRMQGMSGNKVKVLIDGVPINGRQDGNIDLSQLNTYNLERIEIIQGPMSVMYGTDALGGVINLITKNSKKKFELSGEAYYETVGKYNFNASAVKSFGNHHFTMGGGRNYFDGYGIMASEASKPYPHRTSAFKPKEQYLGNFNYSFNQSEKFSLRFASDFVKEKIVNRGPVAYIDPFKAYAFDDYYRVIRSMNRLTVDGKFKNGGRYQLINGYTLYYRTKNTYNKDLVSLQQTLTNTEGAQDTSTYSDFNFRGMYENQFLKALNYTIGYDVNLQYGKSERIPENANNIGDYAAFLNLSNGFFNEKLKIQAAARVNHNTEYKSPLVPSFNLLYKATPTVSIRASYAKGFRAPSMKELHLDFVDNNHKIFGNTNLKAEVGDHLQGSASWMVFEKGANYGQVLVTGFYNSVYNQIALAARYPGTANSDSAQFYDYTNILRSRNFIANLEFEGQYSNFYYKLGYSYAKTFAQENQYSSFSSSDLTTTLQYYWKRSKLNFSLFNRFNGTRPFLLSNIDGSSSYSGKQPAYNMMDISVSRKCWKQNIQITAGVKNVFDVLGFSSGSVVTGAHGGDGNVSFVPRSFFTSLRFNFD